MFQDNELTFCFCSCVYQSIICYAGYRLSWIDSVPSILLDCSVTFGKLNRATFSSDPVLSVTMFLLFSPTFYANPPRRLITNQTIAPIIATTTSPIISQIHQAIGAGADTTSSSTTGDAVTVNVPDRVPIITV